jgi:hypothetical protein
MRNVTVYGGHDGFDVRVCDNVLVEDCNLTTGDDCIAGFDNNDVVIRRCIFDTACSALRFGGNNVLVEECTSIAPASFGHRLRLTQEQKRMNVATDANCRHNMGNVFLYYCDHRADPRRTPGDILLRNCKFIGADRLFTLAFDGKHKWCCNRSLSSIKFENCVVTGLNQPAYIYGDENEPLTFELENVQMAAREGFEKVAVVEARNFDKVSLKNVTLEGFADPVILKHTEGEISVVDSTPTRAIPADQYEKQSAQVW